MKKIGLLILLSVAFVAGYSQRVMTEGTILYSVSVTGNNAQEAAGVFNGATLTIYLKANMALQELRSNLLNQTIIYDGKADSAVILKQAGEQKFIINLNPADWKDYNRRYNNIKFTETDSTQNITGFICKKAVAKLDDGTQLTAWYATGLSPVIRSYDYQFKTLPGIVLEYEVQNGPMKVTYTASKVLFNPVPAFKFEVPKTGYRILDYKSSK